MAHGLALKLRRESPSLHLTPQISSSHLSKVSEISGEAQIEAAPTGVRLNSPSGESAQMGYAIACLVLAGDSDEQAATIRRGSAER